MSTPDKWFADGEAEVDFILLFPVVCCRGLQDVLLGVANAPEGASILFQVLHFQLCFLYSKSKSYDVLYMPEKDEGKMFSFRSSTTVVSYQNESFSSK